MSGHLALLAVIAFVLVMLAWDARRTPALSSGVWLSVVWMVLLASKPLVHWVDPSSNLLESDPSDGNPLDRTVYSAVLALSGIALLRRRVSWMSWIQHNPWLFAFILFAGLSVIWSDHSEVAAKRWIRGLGSVLAAMLILSEHRPGAAIAAVVRRSAIVLIPLSVVLIKYFRDWAVGYNGWTGEEYLAGATTDKNALGRLCLIAALFACWSVRSRSVLALAAAGRIAVAAEVGLFAATLWLLWAAKSSTSLACFAFGIVLLAASSAPVLRRRPGRLVTTLVVLLAALIALTLAFDVPDLLVRVLGRDLTLTGRVFIWQDMLGFETNPLIGVGYASFWLGQRLSWFLEMHQVVSAHNGFLDIYVNLGMVGLLFFGAATVGAIRHALQTYATDPALGQLRLVMVLVFLTYNTTETASLLTSLMFFVFLLAAMRPPTPGVAGVPAEQAHAIEGSPNVVPHGTQ